MTKDVVFYQGETIPINISGDEKTDLKNHDFVMLVYPHYDIDNVLRYHKSDFREEETESKTVFRCEIPYGITSELPVGDYVIEILVSEYDGYRSVCQNLGAFTLKFSNAKNER